LSLESGNLIEEKTKMGKNEEKRRR